MRLSIVEPKGIIYQRNVREVVLPVDEGELSVLDFHQDLVAYLNSGLIRVLEYGLRPSPENIKKFKIKEGIVKLERNEMFILVRR